MVHPEPSKRPTIQKVL